MLGNTMGSGAGICSSDEISVLLRHSKRSPGNTFTPTLHRLNFQKLSKPSDRFGVNQECFSKISFVKAW